MAAKTSTVTGKAGGPKKDVGFELFNDLGVGNNSKIDKVMKGSEGLLGDAQGVTGKTGFGENRLGDQLGTQLKDTGGGEREPVLRELAMLVQMVVLVQDFPVKEPAGLVLDQKWIFV